MTRGYSARLLDRDEHEAWDRFVDASRDGSPYHASAYLDVLCARGGGRYRILGVHEGEELVGGVPLYERDASTGTYVQPRLLLYYNGLVLRDYETRYPSRVTSRHLGIMEALEKKLSKLGHGGVELRCRSSRDDVRPFLDRGWSATPSYTYVVPLEDPRRLWKRVDPNLRRLVDRAREQSVQVTEDRDFESFYRLHRTVHEHKGAPLYLERSAFEPYFEDLHRKELMRLFHARLPGGRAVSSLLILASDHPVTHTVAAAADPEHYDTGASPYLRWKVFETLAEDGYEGNDLTDASLGSVARFKRQLGSDLRISLVLQAPPKALFRAERRARALYWRTRTTVGDAVRNLGRAFDDPA